MWGQWAHGNPPDGCPHNETPMHVSLSMKKSPDIFTLNLTMWTNGIGSNRIHWQYCFKELHSFSSFSTTVKVCYKAEETVFSAHSHC